MTFLNPLILFGLIASSIPIILHLLNLRKLRKIEFSSLIFLKELQKNKIRKVKIKQILLLIIRTLIIILLVFSFSRPVIKGYLSGFGSHAKTSIVIILDDSYSMNVSDENGSYFNQAKEAASQIIDLMEEGDDITVVRTSDLPEATIKHSQNFRNAKIEMDAYRASLKTAPLPLAMNLASEVLLESKNYNKEIYVISDNQKVNYLLDEQEKITRQLFDNNTRLYIIDIGNKRVGNSTIENVEIENKIFEKDKPVNLKINLRNYGEADSYSGVMSLYINGKRVNQKSLDIQSSGVTNMSFVPNQNGSIEGYVELEEDELPKDDRFYFSFYIPEKLNILLTGNEPSDYDFLQLALNAFADSDSASSANKVFNITTRLNNSFASINLSSFDVVIFTGANSLTQSDLNRVKSFMESGGGVIYYPSRKYDSVSTNNFFSFFNLGRVQSFIEGMSSFSKTDYDHPLFLDIFESSVGSSSNRREIESPQVTRSLDCKLSNQSRSIIDLSNSTPFLFEHIASSGKILVYTVNPSLDWSDFPFKGLFIPITYKSLFYVSNRHESGFSMRVGEAADIVLSTSNGSSLVLREPNGEEEKILMNQSIATNYYHFSNPTETGIYSFYDSGEKIKSIPVNMMSAESDIQKADEKEIFSYLQIIGMSERYKYLKSLDDVSIFLQEARYGVELWKQLLLLALLLVIIEMLIARDSKKDIAKGN